MRSLHVVVVIGIGAAHEHQEGQVEAKEQHEEHDCGPERAQEQDCREDEPAGQEETNGGFSHLGINGCHSLGRIRASFAENVPVRSE